MGGFPEDYFRDKQYKKDIIVTDLSKDVLKYLKESTGKEYFTTLKSKRGNDFIQKHTVSIYEKNILPIPFISTKICDITASRQLHDLGDIEKIHEDGSVEYRIFSDAKIESKIFDNKISKNTLDNILSKVNIVDTFNIADNRIYNIPFSLR